MTFLARILPRLHQIALLVVADGSEGRSTGGRRSHRINNLPASY